MQHVIFRLFTFNIVYFVLKSVKNNTSQTRSNMFLAVSWIQFVRMCLKYPNRTLWVMYWFSGCILLSSWLWHCIFLLMGTTTQYHNLKDHSFIAMKASNIIHLFRCCWRLSLYLTEFSNARHFYSCCEEVKIVSNTISTLM